MRAARRKGKVLIIDNYDSFVHNLAQYVGELGWEPAVLRNDSLTVDEAMALRPTHIVISPGPGRPEDAGISVELARRAGAMGIPLLGVCLGHQVIAVAYGGYVGPARTLMHGKASAIRHNAAPIFAGLPNPFIAGRYHSLAVSSEKPGKGIEVVAVADDLTVMAIRHVMHPVVGLQFHPESVLTPGGKEILRNFLEGRI